VDVDFSRLVVCGADNKTYHGQAPSTIPGPFKGVKLAFPEHECFATVPEGVPVVDINYFEAFITVVLEDGAENHAYKLVTVLKDGRKWGSFYSMEGMTIKSEWV
jgi:hypothetical protein